MSSHQTGRAAQPYVAVPQIPRSMVLTIEEELAKIIDEEEARTNSVGSQALTPQQKAFVGDRAALLRKCQVSANQLQKADEQCRKRRVVDTGVRLTTVEQCEHQIVQLQKQLNESEDAKVRANEACTAITAYAHQQIHDQLAHSDKQHDERLENVLANARAASSHYEQRFTIMKSELQMAEKVFDRMRIQKEEADQEYEK